MTKQRLEPTLAKIQSTHGCNACRHKKLDDYLAEQSRFWCAKQELTLDGTHCATLAVECVDWQLVSDKDERQSFIGEALGQQPLPGVDA